MRIYSNMYECAKETQRNLSEMGTEVRIKTMQNINVEDNEDLNITKEILGETYQISHPFEKLKEAYKLIYGDKYLLQRKWVLMEHLERIVSFMGFSNPGYAYKIRSNEWAQFLNSENKFDYTYNERIHDNNYDQIDNVVNCLEKDPGSRRAIISIWNTNIDSCRIDINKRIPCSMTYHLMIRDNKLINIYHMRSSDFYSHWLNDMNLAALLCKNISDILGIESGKLIVYLDSLHAYKKSLKIRGIF